MKCLRGFIRDVVAEALAVASPEYMKKEAVRQQIQELIASKVSAGEIQDQKQLDEWFQAASMSLMALKMVPLDAYKLKTLAKKSTRK
jgi:hypothetical protein